MNKKDFDLFNSLIWAGLVYLDAILCCFYAVLLQFVENWEVHTLKGIKVPKRGGFYPHVQSRGRTEDLVNIQTGSMA